MSGNAHVRCEAGENPEMVSKDYLSLYFLEARDKKLEDKCSQRNEESSKSDKP